MLTFQTQPLLWTEITKLTEALRMTAGSGMTEEQEFYLKMFQHISYEVQHKILLLTANHMENSLDHCRLILLLMKRFPQAIPQHARCLLETLIAGIGTPNGHLYREMLINDALPLIRQKHDLPSNFLNLIVELSIEHYVVLLYRRMTDEKFVLDCWRKIFETLDHCAGLMKWEKFVTFNPSFGKDIYLTRLLQINASTSTTAPAVDNKQVFYTSFVLFAYCLQEYMSNVSRRETTKNQGEGTAGQALTCRPEFVLVEALRDLSAVPPKRRHSDAFKESIKIHVAEPCDADTPNCLITAAHCWQLMNSTELRAMEKNQLLVRLPIGDWVTRFISDLAVYLGRPDDIKAILTGTGVEKDVKLLSLAVLQNNLGTQIVGPLILDILKELAQSYQTQDMPQGEYLKDMPPTNGPGSGRSLILLPMTKRAILQYCVRILISKLSARLTNLMTEPSDAVLGYLLVLLQLNWPSGMPMAVQIFKIISAKRAFSFMHFNKFIVAEILEEFSYMRSQHGGEVNLEVTNAKTRNYGTRRNKDDFKQVLREQMQRAGNEDVDFLIILFILQEQQIFNEILL